VAVQLSVDNSHVGFALSFLLLVGELCKREAFPGFVNNKSKSHLLFDLVVNTMGTPHFVNKYLISKSGISEKINPLW
jgi:hypothetical protein